VFVGVVRFPGDVVQLIVVGAAEAARAVSM
jgi:hypothetical protein